MNDNSGRSKRLTTRRALLERTAYAATALAATPLLARCSNGDDATPRSPQRSALDTAGAPVDMPPPLQIAMLLYPNFTMLDLTGPQCVLCRIGQTHLVSHSLEPVLSDTGIALVPTTTYDQCPTDLDVLFVPGGYTADCMLDSTALAFLRTRAASSRYVTSVCTGALILAAAGLLNGYRATTHWGTRDILSLFDVEVVHDRVVVDRNRVTGGGVTAGIDFGLSLVAILRDEQLAKTLQLAVEYNPAPPFDTGEPEAAGPELVERVTTMTAQSTEQIRAAAQAAVASMM